MDKHEKKLKEGYFDNNSNLPEGLFNEIIDYPYKKYKNKFIYRLRRSANVLNNSSECMCCLSGGSEIVCDSSEINIDFPEYKKIIGIMNNGSIEQQYDGCYIDMGLRYGPYGKTMTIHGTF